MAPPDLSVDKNTLPSEGGGLSGTDRTPFEKKNHHISKMQLYDLNDNGPQRPIAAAGPRRLPGARPRPPVDPEPICVGAPQYACVCTCVHSYVSTPNHTRGVGCKPKLFRAPPEGVEQSGTLGGSQGTEHLRHAATPLQAKYSIFGTQPYVYIYIYIYITIVIYV